MNLDQLIDHAKEKHTSAQKEVPGVEFTNPCLVGDSLHVPEKYWCFDFHVLGGQTFVSFLWKENDTFHTML
jgi:hypothetical protein